MFFVSFSKPSDLPVVGMIIPMCSPFTFSPQTRLWYVPFPHPPSHPGPLGSNL